MADLFCLSDLKIIEQLFLYDSKCISLEQYSAPINMTQLSFPNNS